jgi:hypothetical protein
LRIYGRNTDNTTTITVSSYGVNTDSWSETAITFNTAPAASTSALSSVGVNNTAKYYELDVTSYVKTQFAGDKIVSLLIKNPTTQNSLLSFNSREKTSNRPQLVVVSSATVARSGEEILSSETDFKKLLVYPNPVRNKFNVRLPSNVKGDVTFQIVDLAGRMYNVGKTTVQPGATDINVDISKLALLPGVYFLKVNSKAMNEQVKLIVQ